MDENVFLQAVLQRQELPPLQLGVLRRMRELVEARVCELSGYPMVYYAGSYAKHTMITERFDLDIVAYWPPDCAYTLAGIYRAVGKTLRKRWPSARPKTVAWEIPFPGRFHIDVVPGRAMDNSYLYANLFRRPNSRIQTSIKKHIKAVRDSGRCDVIKLMKLWRLRKRVPFANSLLLELLTIEGAKGCSYTDLAQQMNAVFEYIYDNILTVRVEDPANTNNVVSDELTKRHRFVIRKCAIAALKAKTWGAVLAPRSPST
jgi:hypothetical protein